VPSPQNLASAMTKQPKEQEDARLDPTRAMVSLPGNVTATVTACADRSSTPTSTGFENGSVGIRGVSVNLDSEPAKTFVTECARNIEGLRSDQEIREAWGLDEREWTALADNTPVLNAIKAERERRIRSGEAAREAAQQHFAKAPSILNDILQNDTISPRHRIEAAKELRQVAGGGRENEAAAERFTIVIDLGEDYRLTKEFDQPASIADDDGETQ
jgi:hypothetical protein